MNPAKYNRRLNKCIRALSARIAHSLEDQTVMLSRDYTGDVLAAHTATRALLYAKLAHLRKALL